MIEKTKLDSDESIISLDVKNLYINVPLKMLLTLRLTIYTARMSHPSRQEVQLNTF